MNSETQQYLEKLGCEAFIFNGRLRLRRVPDRNTSNYTPKRPQDKNDEKAN